MAGCDNGYDSPGEYAGLMMALFAYYILRTWTGDRVFDKEHLVSIMKEA